MFRCEEIPDPVPLPLYAHSVPKHPVLISGGSVIECMNLKHLASFQDELGPPALAFVRTVCAVLALDSALEQEVAVLRRNLLKLVHVREFASASEFKVSHQLMRKDNTMQLCVLRRRAQGTQNFPATTLFDSMGSCPFCLCVCV